MPQLIKDFNHVCISSTPLKRVVVKDAHATNISYLDCMLFVPIMYSPSVTLYVTTVYLPHTREPSWTRVCGLRDNKPHTW